MEGRKQSRIIEKQAAIDTIMLQPDNGLFTMAWRCHLPINETILEIPQALISSASTHH
jgi:hypothetical protein